MYYSRFEVSHFRCFADMQKLFFAVPQENELGSGITYIVGENNVGKTTLVESLWVKKDHKLNDSEKRPGDQSPVFRYYDQREEIIKTIELAPSDGYKFSVTSQNSTREFEIISSRRYWRSTASGSLDSFVHETTKGANPRNITEEVGVAGYLRSLYENPEDCSKFTSLIKRVFPDFCNWKIAYEREEYFSYQTIDGLSHKSDFLGDGVISVIRILAHLYDESRKHGLIIDEPELSLHPSAQKKLRQIIAEKSTKRQIIISTHSPSFIEWEYLKKGAVLNRIVKEMATSKIFTISNFEKYDALRKGGNWQQPFLMDAVAKEIFFQDDIVFCEGQEDVGLLKSFFDDGINFFGYGVRGCSKFKVAFHLAKDLGMKKVCAVIDASSYETKEEDKMAEELCQEFPEYKVVQWEREDIRDKKASISKNKNGYFDEKGVLKDDRGDFDKKISEIKEYFKNKL